uniref:Metalloendopeptidase n=1 Tax=Romanomermis culicivorax TaxID=13658 RepID=A0A915IS61_ROMCU
MDHYPNIVHRVTNVKAAPAVFKDELMSHFQPQLNEQRISEVSDLLSRIRQAAKVKFYGGGAESRDDLTEIGLCGYGIKAGGVGVSDQDDVPFPAASCSNKSSKFSGGRRRPLIVGEVTSIGVGHPNFSVPLAKYLFEGDILLTPVQANSILVQLTQENELAARRQERSSLRRKRAILTNDQNLRWKTFPIQYDIDNSYSNDDRQAIQDAISYWSQHTCLGISYSPGVSNGDYVVIFPGNGCYSMVGRQGGKQSVSIGDGCVVSGVIAHEFGHALGLWHEQSRPDADTYIRVLTNNILAGLLSNFLQRTWDTVDSFGVPYDYGSVMHYDSTSFSFDGQSDTIETLQPSYQRTIGQREHPSFYDVKIMNEAYCKDRCAADLDCNYGGYTHPGYCNQCLCPDGTGGYYCERNAEPRSCQCDYSMLIEIN